MKDTKHLLQWKEIRNKYQFQLENPIPREETDEQLSFRISCINDLIEKEELGIDYQHFK